MNAKEAIEKIKRMLAPAGRQGFSGQKPIEAKLEDGTVIFIEGDELAEGVAVKVQAESGEMKPLEDGDYKLEDGQQFSVKDGLVSSIEKAEKEADAKTEKKVEEAVKVAMAKFSSEKEQELKVIKADFELHRKAFTQLLDIVEKLAAVPEAGPAKKVHSPFAKQVDKVARFKEMAETLKSISRKN